MATDIELLDRWVAGEEAAARELVERYFLTVYRFFLHKTPTDVEDLVQDTFAACMKARDRFRRESTFRTFLLGMARNKLLHHYRDRREFTDLSDVAEARLVDLDPTPSARLAKKEEERLLLEALRRLPLDYQIVIELYSWEKLPGAEAARVLEISEAAMRSRLHRAKQDLRRLLEELSESPTVLESTLANLDGWAAALRERR